MPPRRAGESAHTLRTGFYFRREQLSPVQPQNDQGNVDELQPVLRDDIGEKIAGECVKNIIKTMKQADNQQTSVSFFQKPGINKRILNTTHNKKGWGVAESNFWVGMAALPRFCREHSFSLTVWLG